jgi:transposase, IS5 family
MSLEMVGTAMVFRLAMRPGKCRALSDIPDGRLQYLIVAPMANVSTKVEHPFRFINKQFGFHKIWLRDLAITVARSMCL